MRTTLDIDDFLVKKLLEVTHEKSKTKAITIAIKDYIKKKRIKKIISYQGKLDMENNWQQQEKEEIEEYENKK
ncbi:MAG: transcription regulator of the Arc/MetJ class [Candidatus Scalindua rubra]|uniref:Transcription regulator of the Arc/MetJ class n=1 Tax=Candidatus Scalindua rubra TaxID=1872076 RepID=A0A1E3XCD0_9BACT|nr:MAG: transcription regulator of the Arc/MetJ class [Candidatus Scalindua rubra]